MKSNKTKAYTARNTTGYNQFYRQYLLGIIDKYAAQNIHVIYILPPFAFRMETESQMLNLFETLPEVNRVDMSSPLEFPEFYELSNRFDQAHLNGKGAELYTRKLVEKFKSIQDQLAYN